MKYVLPKCPPEGLQRIDFNQWGNGRIIALLTLMGVLAIVFIAVQILLPKTATIPPRIFKQRSIAAGCWATTCIGASSYIYSQSLTSSKINNSS